MPDSTHDTPKRRRPRICGVMSASGPEREMLACAYKPGHKGDHSWASLPTFPLHAEVVIGEVGRLLLERYGGFADFPEDARGTYSWLVDTLLGPGQHHLPSITRPSMADNGAHVKTLEQRCAIQRDAVNHWRRKRALAEAHIEQHRRALSRLMGELERANA